MYEVSVYVVKPVLLEIRGRAKTKNSLEKLLKELWLEGYDSDEIVINEVMDY